MTKDSLGTLIPLQTQNSGLMKEILLPLANALLERLLYIKRVKDHYRNIPPCSDPFHFLDFALKALNIKYRLDKKQMVAIPRQGPAIVVANHPFGGIDGLVLASVLAAVRKDFKILVNYLLQAVPDLRPLFLPVDPFGSKGSARKNIASLGRAVRWVRGGGMLVLFPAGEVSHFSLKNRTIEDPKWNETVSRIILLTKAPVLPIFFQGRNSIPFHVAGLIHPRLRTAMLPREMLKKKNRTVVFKIGSLIPFKRLHAIQDPVELSEYLRFRTDLLRLALEKNRRLIRFPKRQKPGTGMQAIVASTKTSSLTGEVESLPLHQTLMEGPDFSVHIARAEQIPKTLREIGRLREETFRLAGEGTGKAIDLDPFDSIYLHLFVWNIQNKEIAGAYRLGQTDEILARFGKKGLYTYTLFKYSDKLLQDMGPALEMGRSFITKAYQKSYSPLLLLWKGIGRFVASQPRYRTLFGPVSISNDYLSHSRRLMAAFLEANNNLADFSRMVKPRRRFRQRKNIRFVREKAGSTWADPDELSTWISELEEDDKGMPILLKQYLKLGGRVLSFNLDRKFRDALDGLILVDLTRADGKMLKRHMGAEGFQEFMAHQTSSASRRSA